MKIKKIILIFVIISIFIFFCGCLENPIQDKKNDHIQDNNIENIELVKYNFSTNTYWYGEEYIEITGIIKNNKNKTVNTLEITVNFFDNNGNFLDKEIDFIYYILSDETKDFIIAYDGDFKDKVDDIEIEFKII